MPTAIEATPATPLKRSQRPAAIRWTLAVLRWIVAPLATILIASFLVALALSIAPGDPIASLVGNEPTQARIDAIRNNLGLNESVMARYWTWLTGVVHGDFGHSIALRSSVSNLISARLPITIFLVVYSAVLILFFGLVLGIIGGAFKRAGTAVALVCGIGVAIPSFVAAQLLVQYFSLTLELFPAIGAGSGFTDRLWHLTLPAIALSMAGVAYFAQITRASIREEAAKEHVITARGRGVPPLAIFRRHVFRNASLPIVTIAGLIMASLLAGATVVETAFGINGIGSLLVTSVSSKDYKVVQAIVLILVIIFVVVTSLIDLIQYLMDPRLRAKGDAR